ncbi:MAG: beta-lactamase family protein [Armatimonadetes bacterium]|nr:beta-lactamase family protein [Armatimonadota bacterium]
MAKIKTDATKAGFDPAGLERAEAILNEGVTRKLYPGGSAWVWRRDTDAMVCSAGWTDYSEKEKVDENTLFDMASVTKSMSCGPSILMLAQEGAIDISIRSVTSYFPKRDIKHLSDITLHHLLTHTSGLPAWQDMYSNGQTRDQLFDELFGVQLINPVGSTHVYSCLGYIMLSAVLETVAGERIDSYVKRKLFAPLGLESTGYNPVQKPGVKIAATDNCPYRKHQLVGEVHDGNAYAMEGVSGNAGLFSTARDTARFCRQALDARRGDGTFPLNPPVLHRMFTNAISESVGGHTWGWCIWPNDGLASGDFVTKSAIGHTGFTGTCVAIDPEHDAFAILLTNRVCNNDDGLAFRHLRRRFFNAVFGSIMC